MDRVLAVVVLRARLGVSLTIEGRADRLGDVFAREPGACCPVAGVEDDRGYLIYGFQSVSAQLEAPWGWLYLQHTRLQLVQSTSLGCSLRAPCRDAHRCYRRVFTVPVAN
mgnify:CR=1 FL=1